MQSLFIFWLKTFINSPHLFLLKFMVDSIVRDFLLVEKDENSLSKIVI